MLKSTSPTRISLQLAELRERRRAVDTLIHALEIYQRVRAPKPAVRALSVGANRQLGAPVRWAGQMAS